MIRAVNTGTNGQLIAAVASLYCPDPARETWRVFDPTFGRGKMWTHWRPEHLICPDSDFTAPYHDGIGLFDLILFDPPYTAKGGRATKASVIDHDDRYGREAREDRKTALTPAEVKRLVLDGMSNLVSYLKPGGMLWVKSADYVTSGKVQWGNHDVRVHGRALGLTQLDEFLLLSNSPQPEHARQVHARRGFSILTVWRA